MIDFSAPFSYIQERICFSNFLLPCSNLLRVFLRIKQVFVCAIQTLISHLFVHTPKFIRDLRPTESDQLYVEFPEETTTLQGNYLQAKINFTIWYKFGKQPSWIQFDDDRHRIVFSISYLELSRLPEKDSIRPFAYDFLSEKFTIFNVRNANLSKSKSAIMAGYPEKIQRRLKSIIQHYNPDADLAFIRAHSSEVSSMIFVTCVQEKTILELRLMMQLHLAKARIRIFYHFILNENRAQFTEVLNGYTPPQDVTGPFRIYSRHGGSPMQITTRTPCEYVLLYELLSNATDEELHSFKGVTNRVPVTLEKQLEFRRKMQNFDAHGIELDKGGIANLTNLILEGKLRQTMYTGPIGNGDYRMPDTFSGDHGPYYILTKNTRDHLAYIVPDARDKEVLTTFLERAQILSLIAPTEKTDLLKRLFTYDEIKDLSSDQVAHSEALETFISTRT